MVICVGPVRMYSANNGSVRKECLIVYPLQVSNCVTRCKIFTTYTFFTTTHLYTNMKLNPSNVVIFILIEENGSYVIR